MIIIIDDSGELEVSISKADGNRVRLFPSLCKCEGLPSNSRCIWTLIKGCKIRSLNWISIDDVRTDGFLMTAEFMVGRNSGIA
jgi:hypothetical protein